MKMSTKENPEVYLDVNDLLSSKCSKSSLPDLIIKITYEIDGQKYIVDLKKQNP